MSRCGCLSQRGCLRKPPGVFEPAQGSLRWRGCLGHRGCLRWYLSQRRVSEPVRECLRGCLSRCGGVVRSAPGRSPSTWSRGTPTCSTSSTARRTLARRSSVRATSSTPCGSPTCSCGASSRTPTGPSCVPTSVPASTTSGDRRS